MVMIKVLVMDKVMFMVKEHVKMKVKVMVEVKIHDKVKFQFKEVLIIGTIYYNLPSIKSPLLFNLHSPL